MMSVPGAIATGYLCVRIPLGLLWVSLRICDSRLKTKASLKETRFSLDDLSRATDYTVIGRKWYYSPSPDQ